MLQFSFISWEVVVVFCKHAKVSVGLLKILRSYAESLGVDFKNVAEIHNVDLEILGDGEAKIRASIFEALWLKIAALGNDPYPGLNFGKHAAHNYPEGSILFSMMRNCPNVGKALEVFVRYHRVMADSIQPLCVKNKSTTHLSWDLSIFNLPNRSHLTEALLCTYHSILKRLSMGQISPVAIHFIHRGPEVMQDRMQYDRHFEAPVHFQSEKNELIIDNRDLAIKIEFADASLLTLLDRHAKQLMEAIPLGKGWSFRVAQLINKKILSGDLPMLNDIAGDIAVSKRSLQEKLKSEGICFRDLVQIVRTQIAIDQLSSQGVSISEVAFMLGYSEQSAFNHAFKKWTGKKPKMYTTVLIPCTKRV